MAIFVLCICSINIVKMVTHLTEQDINQAVINRHAQQIHRDKSNVTEKFDRVTKTIKQIPKNAIHKAAAVLEHHDKTPIPEIKQENQKESVKEPVADSIEKFIEETVKENIIEPVKEIIKDAVEQNQDEDNNGSFKDQLKGFITENILKRDGNDVPVARTVIEQRSATNIIGTGIGIARSDYGYNNILGTRVRA